MIGFVHNYDLITIGEEEPQICSNATSSTNMALVEERMNERNEKMGDLRTDLAFFLLISASNPELSDISCELSSLLPKAIAYLRGIKGENGKARACCQELPLRLRLSLATIMISSQRRDLFTIAIELLLDWHEIKGEFWVVQEELLRHYALYVLENELQGCNDGDECEGECEDERGDKCHDDDKEEEELATIRARRRLSLLLDDSESENQWALRKLVHDTPILRQRIELLRSDINMITLESDQKKQSLKEYAAKFELNLFCSWAVKWAQELLQRSCTDIILLDQAKDRLPSSSSCNNFFSGPPPPSSPSSPSPSFNEDFKMCGSTNSTFSQAFLNFSSSSHYNVEGVGKVGNEGGDDGEIFESQISIGNAMTLSVSQSEYDADVDVSSSPFSSSSETERTMCPVLQQRMKKRKSHVSHWSMAK